MSISHPSYSAPVSALEGLAPVDAPYSVEAVYLNGKSLSFRARQRRFRHVRAMIEEIIREKGRCRIADIGGTEYYWEIARDYLAGANVEIHLMNLVAEPVAGAKFKSHAADACAMDAFEDDAFDLVHSNSVIEHVGQWSNMKKMAANVRRLAPAYYLQTPNFWFPYEPHFRFPMFQFLPEQVRARMLTSFSLGFGGRRESLDEAMIGVQSASLIDAAQLRELFPDAQVLRERVGPFTKSLMAVRQRR
jgi:hypothetical protein